MNLIRAALTSDRAMVTLRRCRNAPAAGDRRRQRRVLALAAQGERVGWLERGHLYLNMEAAYGAAQRMATVDGGIDVSLRVLVRRLHDRGFLVSIDDKRETFFARRNLQGRQWNVLHLSAGVLSISSAEPDSPDNEPENESSSDSRSEANAAMSGSNAEFVGLRSPT